MVLLGAGSHGIGKDGHRFLAVGDGPVLGDAIIAAMKRDLPSITPEPCGAIASCSGQILPKVTEARACPRRSGHFADALCPGEPFETAVAEYLGAVAVMEAAYRSAAENRIVRIQEFLPASV